jgi:hypothetical protein
MNRLIVLTTIFISTSLIIVNQASAQLNRSLKENEIKALKANIIKNPANIKSRLFLADHYYSKKNWKLVIETLSPVVETLPDVALNQISTSYMEMGNLRESESIINILLSRPNVKTEHRLLAVKIYSGMIDNLNQSIESKPWVDKLFLTLKTAQENDPKNRIIYDVWLEKLEKYIPNFANESLRVMEDLLAQGIILRPKDYSLLCKFNHLAHYTKSAKIACDQAIIKDPQNPNNIIYLGENHIINGDEAMGKRLLANVGEKFSESEEALWATANNYYQNKNISSAYTYFHKAAHHKDAKPRDFLGLAKSSFELKKFNEALNSFVEHCRRTNFLDQEFRRASGLLKDYPLWQDRYRKKMIDCKSETSN